MNDGNKAKTLTAPAVAVLAVDTEFHEHIPTLLPFRPELKDVFAADPARAESTSQFNATLQAAYFLLSVRAQSHQALQDFVVGVLPSSPGFVRSETMLCWQARRTSAGAFLAQADQPG